MQAVETALTSMDPSSISMSPSDFAVPTSGSVGFLRHPIFVVGAATEKIAYAQLSPILNRTKQFDTCADVPPTSTSLDDDDSTASASAPGSRASLSLTARLSSEATDERLNFFGSESNNAKNLAEYIVQYFRQSLEEGKGKGTMAVRKIALMKTVVLLFSYRNVSL